MFWCLLLGALAQAKSITFFSLSPDSNPDSQSIQLPVDYSFFNDDFQDYSLEFWIRPRKLDTESTKQILREENDWVFNWLPESNLIEFRNKDSGLQYCTFSNVISGVWTHIAISRPYSSLIFNCYKDARRDQVIRFGNKSPQDQYPDNIYLGNNFHGNIAEMRFWLREVRSEDSFREFLNKYFEEPYPNNLNLYWRLVEPTELNVIEEYIGNRDTTIPNSFVQNQIWVQENVDEFICSTSQYLENGNCIDCHPECEECVGGGLSNCEATLTSYLDRGKDGTQGLDFIPTVSQPKTIEVWIMPNSWNSASQPVIDFAPLLKIRRKASTQSIIFLNANSQEKLTVDAPTKKFMHIAFVIDITSAVIYINGQKSFEGQWYSVSQQISRVYLGRSNSESTNFNGIIHDLRFWDTLRTSEQINNFKDYKFTSPYPSDLKEYWRLDEGSGTGINDLVNNQSKFLQTISNMWRKLNCLAEECIVQCETENYKDNSSVCQACDVSCNICSGPGETQCLECAETYSLQIKNNPRCYSACPNNYVQLNQECVTECPSDYYLENGLCQKCFEDCKTCSGPQNDQCASCFEGFELLNGQCRQICPSGQYVDDSNECNECDDACGTCDGPEETSCTSCEGNKFLYEKQCYEQCPTRTYPQGSVCLSCSNTCETCNGPEETNCLTCRGIYPYRDNSGRCVSSCENLLVFDQNLCVDECPEKYYLNNNICRGCNENCRECNGPSASDCTECEELIYNGECFEECPSITFRNGNTCQDCNERCEECQGPDPDQCTVCSNQFPLREEDTNICLNSCNQDYFQVENSCVKSCPEGYFGSSNVCVECSGSCADCEGSASSCTACKEEKFLFGTVCQDSCPTGYFVSEGVCAMCDSSCLECKGAGPNMCTSCGGNFPFFNTKDQSCLNSCPQDTYLLDQTCYTNCPNKFFEVETPSKQCQRCSGACENCFGAGNEECLSCNEGTFLQGTECKESCPQLYFGNTETRVCENCHPECQICSGPELFNCTLCKNNKALYKDEDGKGFCVNNCPDGTYRQGTDCIKCPSELCELCIDEKICEKCAEGAFMSLSMEGKCVEQCEVGEIEDASSRSCVKFSGLFPLGTVNLINMTRIQVDYPIRVKKGSGSITIYKVTGSTKEAALSLPASSNNVIAYEKTFSVSVSSEDFEYGASYQVEISRGAINGLDGSPSVEIPSELWAFSIEDYQLKPLVALINGGLKGVEVRRLQRIELDATASYDPSALNRNGSLSYFWSCSDFTQSYLDYKTGIATSWADYVENVDSKDPLQELCGFWNYSQNFTDKEITINEDLKSNSVYRFVFAIEDENQRRSEAEIYVRIVSQDVETLSFEGKPRFRVNTDKPLQLYSKKSYKNNPSGLRWTWKSSQNSSPYFLTPLSGSWVMTIGEGSLAPDSSYTFSLTYTDFETRTSAVLTFSTNTPPQDGLFYLEESSGTALISIFRGQMLNWADEDLPLTYSFSFVFGDYQEPSLQELSEGKEITEHWLAGPQSSSILSIFLPGGRLSVVGHCYDSLGSKSSFAAKVNVQELTDIIKIRESSENIDYVLSEENVFANVALAANVALELNKTFEENQPVFDIKNRLVKVVEQGTRLADSLYGSDPQKASLLYYTCLIALEPISRYPLSQDIAENILQILNSVDYNRLLSKQKLYFKEADLIEESVQNVISTKNLYNLSQMMSKIIVYLTDNKFSSKLLPDISELIRNTDKALTLNSQVTEFPRKVSLPRITTKSRRDLLLNIQNTTIDLGQGKSIQVPDLSATDQEVSVFASYIRNNPFEGERVALDEYLSVEFYDTLSSEKLEFKELDQSFLFTYNISKNTIETMQQRVSQQRGKYVQIWPTCSYWKDEDWSSDGCSLYNIGSVYSFFEFSSNISDYVQLVCSCNHLSDFTVTFNALQQLQVSSQIINSKQTPVFSFVYWECSLVFYLLLSGMISYIIGLSLAYYWDNFHPGLSNPTVETEKTYRYIDPEKVEAVLSQFEKELLLQLRENSSQKKDDPSIYMSKVLGSSFMQRLETNTTPRQRLTYWHQEATQPDHPIESFLATNSFEESLDFDQRSIRGDSILSKIKQHLKKEIDPRHYPSMVSDQGSRQSMQPPPRADIEATIEQLQHHMHNMENNTYAPTPVEKFLETHDDSKGLPEEVRSMLQRPLKGTHLKSLGYDIRDFNALTVGDDRKLIPNPKALTGNNYASKVVGEVKEFRTAIQLSYCSLLKLYLKKEHKFLSLFFNLHIEYSKKQMLTLLAQFCFLQLLACQAYIVFFNWDFGKKFDETGLCVWGCNKEAQILAGIVCACLPWPVHYLTKYLFSRNMVEYTASQAWKTQAYQNKHCREVLGSLLVFSLMVLCVSGVISLCFLEPFTEEEANDFLFCYVTSLIWSFLVGEGLGAVFKAWFVYLTTAKEFCGFKAELLGEIARTLIIYFPCLLPTEL